MRLARARTSVEMLLLRLLLSCSRLGYGKVGPSQVEGFHLTLIYHLVLRELGSGTSTYPSVGLVEVEVSQVVDHYRSSHLPLIGFSTILGLDSGAERVAVM